MHNFLKAVLLPEYEGTWVEQLTKRTVVVVFGAVVMLRRSLLDNVSRLTFVSLLSFASLIIAIAAIIAPQARSEFHWDGRADLVTPSSRWWLMPGIIVFCFSYQHVSSHISDYICMLC
jgi:amino acid permease